MHFSIHVVCKIAIRRWCGPPTAPFMLSHIRPGLLDTEQRTTMAKTTKTTIAAARRKTARPRGTGSQLIYQRLRDDILRLTRAPGADLDEASLEREFGISRTPIREAIIRLASEELVQVMPNRGARVASQDINEIPQLFEALDLCQRAVFRWAAHRHSVGHLKAMDESNRSFAAASKARNFNEMGDRNRDFHLAVAEAAGNRFVCRAYEIQLNASLRLARTLFASAPLVDPEPAHYYSEVIAQHSQMIDAIRNRNADRAEQLASQHTRLFRERASAYLQASLSGDVQICDTLN